MCSFILAEAMSIEELRFQEVNGNILLFGETLRCPNKRLVNYTFLVYSDFDITKRMQIYLCKITGKATEQFKIKTNISSA